MTTRATKETAEKQRDNYGRFTKGNAFAFKPGQAANPAGRPKKDVCITSLVKEILETDAGKGKTHAQLVAEAIITLAKDIKSKGNIPAIRELLDRIEGKVPETHKIEGDIPVSIIYKLKESEGKE